ncbi:DUF4435 domain-containing protein [Candidatus Electronema sp. TJ]|uniref:DUF4435 domain-containing protein n=1 Tax=Candidatus Electronema sp. TJ TaxID=3401573 RepID=UPI003AA97AB6
MSVQDCLNEDDVITSIRLQLSHPLKRQKVWVVVEGETDQKLYSKLFNKKHVEIEISYSGLTGLLKIVSELLKETRRIIGIRDADFLHLDGQEKDAEHIFLTDFHDAEMMLVSCENAYKQVAAEFLTGEKEPVAVREKLLLSLKFISGIRWLNDSCKLELNFKGFSFGNFYDEKIFKLNDSACLAEIINSSPNRKGEIIQEQVCLKIEGVLDVLNLCNGHDFQKIFALYVTSKLKKGKKTIADNRIGEAFRVAYRFDDFKGTNLYNELKNWADSQSVSLFSEIN